MTLKQLKMKIHYFSWLALISLLLSLAACGASGAAEAEPANSNTDAANAELQEWLNDQGNLDLNGPLNEGGEAEIAADVMPVPSATAVPATTETTETETASATADVDGIPIGFTADGHAYKGNPDAPIVMEEFSDYQCPYCARWASQTLPGLLQNQIANGEVMLVFYDFPLSSIHPQAEVAANAARCAGEQDIAAYWQMHDMLFNRVNEWANNSANAVFIGFGKELGLDMTDFEACVTDNGHAEAVQADLALGETRGVRSTPSFFLNEQALVGAHPTETFNQAITALLNGETIAAVQPTAQPQPEPQEIVIPTPAPLSLEEGTYAFAMGDPDAPAQIVEFTDYQCPYCQQHASQTLPTIIQEMVDSGRVYYVIKDFPLDELHPEARIAAKAVRCAGEQEAYLEMHDVVFNSQAQWGGHPNEAAGIFMELAGELGLDTAVFESCYNSTEPDDLVQANLDEGIALGVGSTPSFFFNGYLAAGALPYENFEQIVTWAESGELQAVVEANVREAYAQQQAQQQQQQQQPSQPTGPVEIPIENAFAIGNPDAPVTIVEYTDYQCPFCARHFAQVLPQLKEKYVDTGLVYYVFKDFPLTSIHPQAEIAAEAARCAGEQNAYLEMHDALFANQGEWNGRDDATTFFINYATEMGLEPTPFSECLESHKFLEAVRVDLNEGFGFGIQGTPTFFINGNIFVGAQPLDKFDQMITAVQNQQ